MKNQELVAIFERFADALEFKGDNFFKILAYRKASRVLNELTDDVAVMHEKNQLHTLPGIGKAIADKIIEYLNTGHIRKYEETIADIPASLLDMLEIPNIGPRTLAIIYHQLKVKTINELKKNIKNGRFAKLPGMGDKKAANIMKGIELYKRSLERMSIAQASDIADDLIEYIKSVIGIEKIVPAGSLRRGKETVGDIDILACTKYNKKLLNTFIKYPGTRQIVAAGTTKASIITDDGMQIDLRIVRATSFGAALQYFTGSKAHNIKLRNIAKARSMKLNEYGLFKGKKQIAGKTEEGIYRRLGLAMIPPEMREDRGEIEIAQPGNIPKLVDRSEILGDLHMHSSYSDSEAKIQELALRATKLGYKYILIADHSKSAYYAHGLEIDRLKKQWQEIDRFNRQIPEITILKGIEVDILPNGRLDYPDNILKQFDLVIASIHQGFNRNATERMITAMENRHVDIIGHPTGRLISSREGYTIDINKIMETASITGTWLELNAFWDRLDLNDIHLKTAKDTGIKISIGTDAHSVEGLDWIKYGVATARRGWLEPEDIVNTYTLDRLLRSRKK
ncbi:DNA polymerase III [candidate division WOR-3 bacterium RBG_13_43_14]|uniref:DNA polymerase beta n=1 Tax=candidate division WOR-3 bacterium RBG_13_43_14 TaxID=1802590 RepID=A0A1F4UE72_UNCW3|nr:MAG: DNA polymerase III [candidate division WOR-3 bacterium RBG_13_43_14]